MSAKWAARWGYAEEPLCDKCDLEGALERNERGEITKYCECPHGQRQKARALREYEEILTARRDLLYSKLRLPEKRKQQTIESYQDWLAKWGEPRMPDYLQKVLDFFQTWDGKENLYLYGDTGGGKTGIIIPLVKLAVEQALSEGWDVRGEWGEPHQHWYARYVRSVDFFKLLMNGFSTQDARESYAAVADGFARAPLLVFDDLGKGVYSKNGDVSEFAYKEYLALFDARTGLPTFYTSNFSPAEIKRIFGSVLHGRIIEGTRIIKVDGPNTRVLDAIARNSDVDPADLDPDYALVDEAENEPPKKLKRVK